MFIAFVDNKKIINALQGEEYLNEREILDELNILEGWLDVVMDEDPEGITPKSRQLLAPALGQMKQYFTNAQLFIESWAYRKEVDLRKAHEPPLSEEEFAKKLADLSNMLGSCAKTIDRIAEYHGITLHSQVGHDHRSP